MELVISSGRPIAEIARDLGIYEGTLGNWVHAAKKSGKLRISRSIPMSGPSSGLLMSVIGSAIRQTRYLVAAGR